MQIYHDRFILKITQQNNSSVFHFSILLLLLITFNDWPIARSHFLWILNFERKRMINRQFISDRWLNDLVVLPGAGNHHRRRKCRVYLNELVPLPFFTNGSIGVQRQHWSATKHRFTFVANTYRLTTFARTRSFEALLVCIRRTNRLASLSATH